jgi:hypothetical protein
LPLPLPPADTVSHDALLDAVQEQPVPAVTVTLPLDPADGAAADSGAIENVQPGDCVIVTRWPPIVAVPDLVGPEVDAIARVTFPSPLPDERPCTVIQLSFGVADHSHSRFALTAIASVPPDAPI